MAQINKARRALFRGHPNQIADVIRPPWALPSFVDNCSRCDACIDSCEESILARGDGGFPEVDFKRGACTFCRACVTACPETVFGDMQGPAWSLKASVNDTCLSARGIVCRSCGDACDPRAIAFRLAPGGRAVPRVETADCNGCGACYSVCPENAIRLEKAA